MQTNRYLRKLPCRTCTGFHRLENLQWELITCRKSKDNSLLPKMTNRMEICISSMCQLKSMDEDDLMIGQAFKAAQPTEEALGNDFESNLIVEATPDAKDQATQIPPIEDPLTPLKGDPSLHMLIVQIDCLPRPIRSICSNIVNDQILMDQHLRLHNDPTRQNFHSVVRLRGGMIQAFFINFYRSS